MFLPIQCEMSVKREGDDKAQRKTICQGAPVMLDGVRDAVDDIADAEHCAANLHVCIVAATGECLSRGNAHAHIEVLPTEHKSIRISLGVREITKSGSYRTNVDQHPGGGDCIQFDIGKNRRFVCSTG